MFTSISRDFLATPTQPDTSDLAKLEQLTGLKLCLATPSSSSKLLDKSLISRCFLQPGNACCSTSTNQRVYAVSFDGRLVIYGKFEKSDTQWALAWRLFSLSVDHLRLQKSQLQQEAELEGFTGHLFVMYEQIHAITHLSRVLRFSIPFDEMIEIFENVLVETLEVRTVFYLEPSEEIVRVQSSAMATHVSAEMIQHLENQLANSTGDVVFASQNNKDDVLCTRVKLTEQDSWLVAVSHDGAFGSEEAQFMLTAACMLESHLLNQSLFEERDLMQIAFVRSLISSLDARDHYTQGHSLRVAELAADLATRLGLPPSEVDTIYTSGLLHDIGKIGISDEVLRKTDRLTDADWEEIKRHPVIGYEILSQVPQFQHILPGVRHHHERIDGKGYPDGLQGQKLTIMSRILAVADAFDAMSSDRPYRPGMPKEKVDRILAQGAGTQWDAAIIDVFLKHRDEIRTRWIGYMNGTSLHTIE